VKYSSPLSKLYHLDVCFCFHTPLPINMKLEIFLYTTIYHEYEIYTKQITEGHWIFTIQLVNDTVLTHTDGDSL